MAGGTYIPGGMCAKGCVHGGGGGACVAGGIHYKVGHAWQGGHAGGCMLGKGGHMWQGGHAWQGGGVHGR